MEIIRGDTKGFKFQRKDGEGHPITTIADKIYFTVKKTYNNLEPIFQKTIDDMTFDNDGTYHFIINPEDTDGIPYGTYYYDIERIQSRDKRTISRGEFVVQDEITFARNEV